MKKIYYDIPPEYDYNSLHIAKAYEDNEGALKVLICLICNDIFDINMVDVSNMDDCYLHEIHIKNSIIHCNKIVETPGDMPCSNDKYVICVSHDVITGYNILDGSVINKKLPNQTIEEPVLFQNTLYCICHNKHGTILIILNVNTLNTIAAYTMDKQISYGFHGIFTNLR